MKHETSAAGLISGLFKDYAFTAADRFFRYVQIDTQSDPASATIPSTEKQKDLGKVLVEELQQLGLDDAHLDQWGYVYATLPSNLDHEAPVICFCSHMDTSPDCSGSGVRPILHRDYDGRDLVLPDDPAVVIRESEHPDLKAQHGNDIITASGTTLLGADNKAGVAAIMDAVRFLLSHPEIPHGRLRILFTPDEEIGRGVDAVDMQKLAADFGYTIDGESLGSLENETFSADALVLTFHGVSAHPGFAKGKLVSALKVAADLLASLPEDKLSPETTSDKEGFIHPVHIKGSIESCEVQFILRDFDTSRLQEYGTLVRGLAEESCTRFPGSSFTLKQVEQYRNMKEILDQHPAVVSLAEEAISRAGIMPMLRSIRGGTDGSRLSFMDLPCPNIFAGEHAFHSKQEWVSVQDMQRSVQTIVHLAALWGEKTANK